MGYNSHLYGELDIDPPLMWAEIKADPAYAKHPEHNQDDNWYLVLDVEENETETDQGTVITRTASRVRVFDDSTKAYEVGGALLGLVTRHHPLHQFSGTIVRAGEENGDVERWVVTGRAGLPPRDQIRNDKAQLRWPDGADATNYWQV